MQGASTPLALFYVTAYHHANNEYTRFLVSVPDGADAAANAVSQTWMGGEPGWTRIKSLFICHTNDDVYMEL
jgi:hypothetical protein